MNIFCLLSAHIWGLVWLGILFGVSFCLVLIAKLVYLGREYQKQQSKPPSPPKTEEKQNSPVQKTEEPVYYIVERKKRVKSSFSEPKQIRFK